MTTNQEFVYAKRLSNNIVFCISKQELLDNPDEFEAVEPIAPKDPIAHEVLKNTRSKKSKL